MMEQQRQIQQQAGEIGRLKTLERPAIAISFAPQNVIQPFTANAVPFLAGIPRAIVTPRSWRLALRVATTNNATNYWTITLRSATAATVATTNTSALAANTWYTVDVRAFNIDPLTVAADMALDIAVTKAGAGAAPGALSLAPLLYVV